MLFRSKRVFSAGEMPGPIDFRGIRLGVPICEDIWTPDVVECLVESGAEILLVPNGSPYETDKVDERINRAVARVTETGLPLVYVNQVGGQDELVFDGASFVLNGDRGLAVQAPAWEEAVTVARFQRNGNRGWSCAAGEIVRPPQGIEAIYRALSQNGSSRWVLDADIAKCFDQIDHAALLGRLPVPLIDGSSGPQILARTILHTLLVSTQNAFPFHISIWGTNNNCPTIPKLCKNTIVASPSFSAHFTRGSFCMRS